MTAKVFEYLLLKAIQLFLFFFSYKTISDLGAFAGSVFYAAGIRKSVAAENLVRSGLQTDQKLLLRSCYRNLGRTFFELLMLSRIRIRQGTDYRLACPAQFEEDISNGAVFISAHLGNWELMGKILVEKNIKLAVVVRKQSNILVNGLINDQRIRAGMKVIYDDDPAALRQCVAEKYCLALLADQDLGAHSVPVTFFGRPCFAPAGPEFLSRKFNLPVFVCFAGRENRYSHRFWIERLDAKENLAQAFSSAIESAVRMYPEQWLWHHRRWKVQA